jgi:hypothetical protein
VSDPIVERIVRESGVPDLFEVLSERLAPTDLQSLLLAVQRARSSRLTPSHVLRAYEQNRVVRPAALDPRRRTSLEQLAASLAPESYEFIELSPIAPLGAVTALTELSQDVALATVRGTEVVSDVTNVLALEAAVRRRRDRSQTVRLAAVERVVRVHAEDAPNVHPHFALLGLVAAGRDRGAFALEAELLLEQLDFYVRLLGAVGARDVTVLLTPLDDERRTTDVLTALRERHSAAQASLDPERERGRGYYDSVCFDVRAGELSIADGGFVDWTQQLLSDRKERLLISGAGLERIAGLSPS